MGAGYVDANASSNAKAAACRVGTADGWGSGSLVDGTPFGLPRFCLLTNHHVIGTADKAQQATCLIGYEDGISTHKHQDVGLRPDDGFIAHCETGRLDFALVAYAVLHSLDTYLYENGD